MPLCEKHFEAKAQGCGNELTNLEFGNDDFFGVNENDNLEDGSENEEYHGKNY